MNNLDDRLDVVPMKMTAPKHVSILQEAEALIHGQRSKDYGHPQKNFQRIADLWNAYLKYSETPGELSPTDTAVMMILLKIARLQQNPTNRDSVVDIAGYAGTIERLWEAT